MEVRSYYATTVEAAMNLARKELGPEAMLIQSERTPPELAHLGRYEVVFAGELQQRAPSPPAATKLLASAPKRAVTTPTPSRDQLRTTVPFRGNSAAAPELGPIDLVSNPGTSPFASILESAGVDREESRRFFDGAPRIPRKDIPREQEIDVRSAFGNKDDNDHEDVAREVACSPGLGRPGMSSSVVALVGPPGAGKTSTIMKLAIQQGLRASRRVRLLALDSHRVCSTSQLRDFAALLDIEFAAFDSLPEAAATLQHPFPGLTLIDTAGYSRSESVALSDMAGFLRAHPDIETQLVIRADRKTADNLLSAARFAVCGPARFILTGVDDTGDHADLRNLMAESAIPLSFLGTGPRIPDDLEPARTRRVANLILRGWNGAARAAA